MSDPVSTPNDLSLFGNADPLVGTTIGDRWEVQEFLGEGSLSSVYKAKDLLRQNFVALKRIHPHLLSNVKNLKRFEQRLKQLATLSHPQIANFRDVYLTNDAQVFLIIDFLNFESLEDILSKTGHIGIERAIDIFRQCCMAIEHADGIGVVHRDIKPSNIIIMDTQTFTDEVKLVDFGIAKALAEEGDSDRSGQYMTRTRESVFGSPLYLSPEQCGGKKLDSRSDLYSLGCVMYETVTGKPPFVGKNVLETAYKHMNEAPKPITTDQTSSDLALVGRMEAIIFKCLAKDPEQRYQSASELRNDLDAVFTSSEQEWVTGSYALRKVTKARKTEKKSVPISFEMMIFGVLTVLLVGVVGFWSVSILAPEGQEYEPFNSENLWVIENKKKGGQVEDFGNREEAAKVALAGVERERGPDCREYADALSSLVDLYFHAGHWNDAAVHCKHLIEVTQKVGGPFSLANCYRILGMCYFLQDDFKEAEEVNKKAVQLLELDPREQAAIVSPLKVLGDIYSRSKRLDDAATIYEKLYGIVDSRKESSPAEYSDGCSRLGDVYRRQGKLNEAERYYRLGIDWWKSHGKPDSVYAAKSMFGLGLVLARMNKFQEAEQCYKDALPMARSQCGERSGLVGAIRRQYMDVLWRTNWINALMMKVGDGEKNLR